MAQTTVTLTPNKDSVLLVSNWYATVGNGSAQGATIYCTSGPQSPSEDITFDLTSIPADKGIVEALLTWDIATWAEGSTSAPTMGFGAEHAKVFPGAQQTSYGVSGMEERGIFTLRVTPGSTFTVRLYYRPGIPSLWHVPSKNYGIGSCNGFCQFSNIRLKVTYSDISNQPPFMAVGINQYAREVKDWFVGINNTARVVLDAWTGDANGKARKIYPGLNASYLNTADVVLIDELGNGNLEEWIVMGQGHYSDSTVTLMRKEVWDSTQAVFSKWRGTTSTTLNNRYSDGTLDNYIQNTLVPSLSTSFQNALVTTNIKCKGGNGTIYTVSRKMWVPALRELQSGTDYLDESSLFNYFTMATTASDRIAKDYTGTAQPYWTRTTITGYPETGSSTIYIRAISDTGSIVGLTTGNTACIRPVICISKTASVIKNSNNNYTLQL